MSDKSRDAFRTISEVADWLGVQPHVLRFWESKFSQVKPVKRAGGRRYYRPNDMLLIGGIRKLLHEDGMTIKGAQKVLREHGMSHVAAMSQPLEDADPGDDPELPDAPMADMSRDPAPATGEVINFTPAAEPAEETATAAILPEPDGNASPDVAASEPELPLQTSLPFDAAPQSQPPAFVEPTLPQTEPDPVPEPTPGETAAPDQDVEAGESRFTPLAQSPDDIPAPAEAAPEIGPADTAAEAPVQVADAPEAERTDAPLASPLPSFMRSDTPAPKEDAAPEPGSDPEPANAIADAPPAPKPQIVDAPDPDEAAIHVHPSALSAAFSAKSLSPDNRTALMPLVAQLAALRDRMAANRSQ